jgi:hypothetical protein
MVLREVITQVFGSWAPVESGLPNLFDEFVDLIAFHAAPEGITIRDVKSKNCCLLKEFYKKDANDE